MSHIKKTQFLSKKILKTSLTGILCIFILAYVSNTNASPANGLLLGEVCNTQNFYIDQDIAKDLDVNPITSDKAFHLLSHGAPGKLLIKGEWLQKEALANWLKQTIPQDTRHVNIYGCEFAKGKKGKQAVSYLEAALQISIAASDDITGIDGDWDLEVGVSQSSIRLDGYVGNLQCANQGTASTQDFDCDGVLNINDLDDDNDGILDTDECLNNMEIVQAASSATSTNSSVSSSANTLVDGEGGGGTGSGSSSTWNAFYPNDFPLSFDVQMAASSTINLVKFFPPRVSSEGIIDSVTFSFYNGATLVGVEGIKVPNYLSNAFVALSNTYNNVTTINFEINTVTSSSGWVNTTELVFFNRTCTTDTDGDGILDRFDLDSDNDGCVDALDGGGIYAAAQVGTDSMFVGAVQTNGIPTLAGTGQSVGQSRDATAQDACLDSDLDGLANEVDLDSDNDGILDSIECPADGSLSFEIDRIQSGFHAVFIKTSNNSYTIHGEQMDSSGTQDVLTPLEVTPANGYRYTGTLLYTTIGSNGANGHVGFVLSTDGIYFWGTRNQVFSPTFRPGTAFEQFLMPPSVSPSSIKQMSASSGGVGLLTYSGDLWLLGSQAIIYGDGTFFPDTLWHKANLTNIESFRMHARNVLARTNSGDLYAWGSGVTRGNGTPAAFVTTPTLLTNPFPSGVAFKMMAITGESGNASYFFLGNNGKVYATGSNFRGQLGIGNNTNQTTWVTVQDTIGTGIPSDLENVAFISAQDNNSNNASVSVILNSKTLYSWGSNSADMLGLNGSTFSYPNVPNGTAGNQYLYVENGGHITPVIALDNKYCNVGHNQGGGFGDGTIINRSDYICNTINSNYDFTPTCDADGDGIPNHIDLDSDGDGCYDAQEAGHGLLAAGDSTAVVGSSGTGSNGLANALETSADNGILNYSLDSTNGTPDFLNPNADLACLNQEIFAANDSATTTQNTLVTISILANDSVSETVIDTSAITIINPTGNGSTTVNADGTIDYTPNIGFTGIDTVTYVLCDTTSSPNTICDTALVFINVLLVETNPDINVTTVNTPVPGNLSTNDNVPTGTTYGSPTSNPGNPDSSTPTINSDGSYTFTSPVAGVFVFTVPVCAEGIVVPNCPEELLTITVTDPSDTTSPPVANTDISTVDSGSTVNIPVLSNDDPTNPGGILGPPSVTTPPGNGTATVQPNGTVDYTPNPGFTGVDTFYYEVCDTTLSPTVCDTAEVIVTVNPSNAPNTIVAADDYTSTAASTAVSGNVMTNDIDPDGDPTTTTSQTTTLPGVGTLVLGTDGSYTFTPVEGFSGPTNFPYEVCDNQGNCTMATLYITVDDPLITNPDINVTTVNTPVPGNVNTNDNVPVGTTYGSPTSNPGNPDSSTPTINSDGSYTFTSSVAGVFVFTVPVCAEGIVVPNCPEELLTITVTDPSDTTSPPVANTDISTVDSGSTVNIPVLSNDDPTNPGGILGPPSVTTPPGNGTATVQPNGTVDYTPNPGFTGVDTFYYEVCDTTLSPTVCDTAEVIVTVNPSNAPNTIVAADDYTSTAASTAVSGNVMTNDIDPDGDPTTTTSQTTTLPGVGTLVLGTDGSYTFTPVEGFSGPTNFPYEVCDNQGNCTMATLYITVDDPLITNPDINVTTVNTPVPGNVNTNDNVPVGTTYGSPTSNPGNPDSSTPTINSDGSYTFTSSVAGVFVFTVPVCAEGVVVPNCPEELLTITVLDTTSTTNPPVANTDIGTTLINTPLTLNTLANDASGNPEITDLVPSSVTVSSAPSNGTTSVDTLTGEITYTPNLGFTGMDTLTYTVCDDSNNCATALQIITVDPSSAPNSITAADDYAQTPMNTAVSGNVRLNDTDPENDNITVTPQNITTAYGTLALDSTGAYTFTPANGFVGTALYPYQICDDGVPQACAEATLYISVPGIYTPLPITLLHFETEWSEEDALLTWTTSSEMNSSHFEVERSINGIDFVKIGNVTAAGNSNTNLEYEFYDKKVRHSIDKIVYYRLRLLDIDGHHSMSAVKVLRIKLSSSTSYSLYPNPTSGQITFNRLDGIQSMLLYNSIGQKILERAVVPNQLTYELNNVANGMYHVVLVGEQENYTFKVRIVKD